MWNYNFYVYTITNPGKTVLYIGVTNDLARRVAEHTENKGNPGSFAGKYYCYNLVYYEHFSNINHAIEREKELDLNNDYIFQLKPNSSYRISSYASNGDQGPFIAKFNTDEKNKMVGASDCDGY